MLLRLFKNKKDVESMRIKLIKKLTYTHGYSILKSSQTLKEDNEFVLELARQYDEYGYMSEELGRELDSLFKDTNYIIGIHRTGYTPIDEKTINSIFNRGLINNGHIMSGGMDGTHDIERTVSLFHDFTIFNGQLKSAHGYKGSEGCVIVKIPKSYLGLADGQVKPIYYTDESVTKLLPEFIYGYVPVSKDGRLGEIYKNPNYSDFHTLNNTNLMYEDKVYYKYKREGIELKQNDISREDKYEIIKKAYQDTLIKYGEKQAEHALLSLINNNDIKYFTGENNRNLLNKYVIYGDILKILSIDNIDFSNNDLNSVITNFIENANIILEENNKLK